MSRIALNQHVAVLWQITMKGSPNCLKATSGYLLQLKKYATMHAEHLTPCHAIVIWFQNESSPDKLSTALLVIRISTSSTNLTLELRSAVKRRPRTIINSLHIV